MWRDRLASQANNISESSSPQPASRPYSPLPPRPSSTLSPYVTSQRPGHSPRGSSISLVSNDSTTSFLSQNRKPNGSALRGSSTAYTGQDSVQVLEKLLAESNDGGHQGNSIISQEDFNLDPDFSGLSLKDIVSHDTGVNQSTIPQGWTQSHSEDYQAQKDKFDGLHRSITACDDILNSVETYLTSFRNDLATVSADIESLQTRSTALNRRLENRRVVEKSLGPLVEELSISPEIISKIAEGHIDESWVRMLSELDRRTTAHEKRSSSQKTKASEDLEPLLEKLKTKAIERIRDYLVAQIKALRSPNINAQIIQQQNFLGFKDLFSFLHRHHPVLAEEISQAYMNTMRWYYLNQFTRYEKALGKIKLHVLDKNDVVGQEESSRLTTVLSVTRAVGPPHDAFNLGRRIDIVKTKNQAALSSYLAEEDQTTHYLEVPFRNFNLALVDNATAEYTFLATFFSPALPYSKISKTFNYIFDPTFELGRTLSKTLTGDTFDALGLLLCIRLNQQLAFELQRRRVPAVDGYVNGTNMLLWPRLQVIMDRHCDSIKALTNAMPNKPTKPDPKTSTAAPHMATQRFGQLLHGFLALSQEAGDDEPVVVSLRRLRSEIEIFLTRQAEVYGGVKKGRFLYNNYSLILTIIGDVSGKLATEQHEYFEALKEKYRE